MFDIGLEVIVETAGKRYMLSRVDSVEIRKSVELLADTAKVILPASVLNRTLDLESKIAEGSKIRIAVGYDDNLIPEYQGYVHRIDASDGGIIIDCEDELYLMRYIRPANKELKPTSIKKIAEYILAGTGIAVSCADFDLGYEKFVINSATAYDVLKKLQEETKANIYFRDKTLHIHPPFVERGGEVVYDFAVNIDSSSLSYKRKADKKVEIKIESIGKDGKMNAISQGTTGGDAVTLKVGNMSSEDMKKIAAAELARRHYDGYEGSITSWLIPYCQPTYSAVVRDDEYDYKNGRYYVVSTTTKVSSAGGIREVTLGIKIG